MTDLWRWEDCYEVSQTVRHTPADTSLRRLVTSQASGPRRLASIAEPPAFPDDVRNGPARSNVQRAADSNVLQAQSDLSLPAPCMYWCINRISLSLDSDLETGHYSCRNTASAQLYIQ